MLESKTTLEVSLLGPTNLEKFSAIIGKSEVEIGIKEFLREERFPPEITADLESMIEVVPVAKLSQTLQTWKSR